MSVRPKLLARLGAILRQRREAFGITQLQMAEAMNMSQPNWSRIESGDVSVTIDALERAADILACEPWRLMLEAR